MPRLYPGGRAQPRQANLRCRFPGELVTPEYVGLPAFSAAGSEWLRVLHRSRERSHEPSTVAWLAAPSVLQLLPLGCRHSATSARRAFRDRHPGRGGLDAWDAALGELRAAGWPVIACKLMVPPGYDRAGARPYGTGVRAD